MTVRSISTPMAPATRKASGHRHEQRQLEPGREAGAAELLDDEGGVGAEHDHLAMRHVDDAHHAEGDGEADRGQQQDRAQADAVDDVLRGGDEREMPLDASRRRSPRRAHRCRVRSTAPRPGSPAIPGRRAPASVSTAARRTVSAAVGSGRRMAARASARASLTVGSCSAAKRLLQRRQGRSVARAEDRLGRLEPPDRDRGSSG